MRTDTIKLTAFILVVTVAVGLVANSISNSPVQAEAVACDSLNSSIDSAIVVCSGLTTNHICYGAPQVTARLLSDAIFERPGHREPLAVFASVSTTRPVGTALMRLQMFGEAPIDAILFGGAQNEPQGANVYVMSVDSGTPVCENTPPGLVVRTETGESGLITVNNVDILLESTGFVTMRDEETMVVANLAGTITVSSPGLGSQPVLVGQEVAVSFENGTPVAIGPSVPSTLPDSPVLQSITEKETLIQTTEETPEETISPEKCAGLDPDPACAVTPLPRTDVPPTKEPERRPTPTPTVCVKCGPFMSPLARP